MLFIEKVKSKPLVIFLTLLHIGFISLFDFVSGSELSFSIFYVIPIAILAANKTSSKIVVVTITCIAAICWFVVEFYSNSYSHIIFPIWNAFVRLAIFITIGVLVFSFRQNNERLDEANKKLKHLNDEKNKFIGIAAHDIRNPISGIYSFSDLLLNEEKSLMNQEELEIVHLIKSLSQNILNLIKNLLDVSKIESGMIELNYLHQDYIQFIKEQIYINQLLANPKGINIHLHSDELQLLADFDSHHMSEVIQNLLSNAIKYSEKKSDIQINVIKNDKEIITEVIDMGKGIPLEEQTKLFNYFQKTSTRPTDGETSTGLGLAIVKKIVTAFNGTIGVKSISHEGSNFYFSFPIHK